MEEEHANIYEGQSGVNEQKRDYRVSGAINMDIHKR
jgi:hypothetical protein